MNLNNVQDEIKAIFKQHSIWVMLGNQDIKLRYRRSSLGPFWITISMAVTIYSMGFLYGHLFKVDIQAYFPYLATGIISWAFLSTLISESTNAFIEAENYIKNQKSILSLFIMRIVLRNIIILFHNLLVYIPVILFFNVYINYKTLLFIPGIFVISINVIMWGTILAVVGTRFRDFAQIINSIIQVVFFVTPIMWMPTLLPEKYQPLVEMNPVYHFLNLIRQPLLGNMISGQTLLVSILFSTVGAVLYGYFLMKYKNNVVFWL